MPQRQNPALPDFINYLATGHTVKQAAEAVKVSPRTGYRWAAQDEVDKQVYERRHTLTAVAIDRLTNATDGICAGLIELAAHGPDNIRVSASKACISTMIQLRKFSEVEGRLRAIESRQQASAESTADSAERWPATMEDGPPNLMGMIRAESTRHTANWLAIRMNDPGRSDYEKEQFQIQIDNLRDTSRHLEWTAGKLDPYIRATIANSQQPIWDEDDPRRTDVRRGAPDPSVAHPSPLGPHPIPDPETPPGSPNGPGGFCATPEPSSPDSVAQPSPRAPRPNLLILLLSASLLTHSFDLRSFVGRISNPASAVANLARDWAMSSERSSQAESRISNPAVPVSLGVDEHPTQPLTATAWTTVAKLARAWAKAGEPLFQSHAVPSGKARFSLPKTANFRHHENLPQRVAPTSNIVTYRTARPARSCQVLPQRPGRFCQQEPIKVSALSTVLSCVLSTLCRVTPKVVPARPQISLPITAKFRHNENQPPHRPARSCQVPPRSRSLITLETQTPKPPSSAITKTLRRGQSLSTPNIASTAPPVRLAPITKTALAASASAKRLSPRPRREVQPY